MAGTGTNQESAIPADRRVAVSNEGGVADAEIVADAWVFLSGSLGLAIAPTIDHGVRVEIGFRVADAD